MVFRNYLSILCGVLSGGNGAGRRVSMTTATYYARQAVEHSIREGGPVPVYGGPVRSPLWSALHDALRARCNHWSPNVTLSQRQGDLVYDYWGIDQGAFWHVRLYTVAEQAKEGTHDV